MSTDSSSRAKCSLNSDGSVCLEDILNSFNSPIREEHAWALCYQYAKFFIEQIQCYPGTCQLVKDVGQVFLQTDGNVHPNTVYPRVHDENRLAVQNEVEVVSSIGLIIFNALDYGNNVDEERKICQELEELISDMIFEENTTIHETDDEGIEPDSEDKDVPQKVPVQKITLQQVVQRCEAHLVTLTKPQAELHYRAVVRALVAEALELATFLETVAKGNLTCNANSKSEFDQLQFADWARFWVQVIGELRQGVKLKKVCYTKAPIEYELTPYEILMKDIRSCRYNLRKIMVNGDVPRVTKDAHAIILEFIRSRPPLKKASERKLPPRQITYSPREQLMHSIKKGTKLRHSLSPPKARIQEKDSPRRLIKIDFTKLDDDDEDSDASETGLWNHAELNNDIRSSTLEAYDLALDCGPRSPTRRYSSTIFPPYSNIGSQSVPQSRPCSRQSCASSDTLEHCALDPDIAKVLQDSSKPWHEAIGLDDRLSLTLEEIVHIRMVLTKAELEALPSEGHVRSDAENRKICFLCLKTRFGILGPWGHKCALCKRTVCSKCCSRMNIPLEHFSSVPVVLLSPSILATPDDEYVNVFSIRSKLSNTTSPQLSPSNSRPGSSMDRNRSKPSLLGKSGSIADKTKGSQLLLVCLDCKMMVQQIIKSAQANRSAIRNKHLQNLSLNLSPVFM